MGDYITVPELVDLFGEKEITQLSSLEDKSATTVNEDRVNAAIDYAESEIRSYMSFADLSALQASGVVPLVLKNKVADIVRYQLDSKRAREDVRLRYEDAMRWLRLLATGQVGLGLGSDDSILESDASDGGRACTPTPTFSRDRLDSTFHYGRRLAGWGDRG